MSSEEPFCGATLENVRYQYHYQNIQGFIDIPICIIGVIFNMFNILMFTRWRKMTSPVNLIFTHLAFVNLSELLAYASLTWIDCTYYRTMMTLEGWTYTRACLALRSRELASIFNHISVYIIMMLAIWKYVAVCSPSKESQWCNMKTTRNTLVAGYIICILFVIPEYLSHYIETDVNDVIRSAAEMYHRRHDATDSIRWIYLPHIQSDSIMYSVSQVVKVGLYELLPSLVLPILGLRLIAKQWLGKNHQSTFSNVESSIENLNTKQQTNRSIIIPMTIVALCLSYVIPLGLVDLVGKVFVRNNRSIHNECFESFRIILGIFNCITKSITFLVYYAMDQDFKVAFKSLFDKNSTLSSTRANDESLLEIDRIIDL